MKLIAVDPGKNHAGVAVFDERNQLIFADVIKVATNPITADMRQGKIQGMDCRLPSLLAWTVRHSLRSYIADGQWVHYVSEWPEHYADTKKFGQTRVQAADLFWLSSAASAIATALPVATVRYFLPNEWKSTVPDDICWNRIKEFTAKMGGRNGGLPHPIVGALIEKHGANSHHAIEAIGIGLFANRSLNKGMVK